jgi:hypothetical protein
MIKYINILLFLSLSLSANYNVLEIKGQTLSITKNAWPIGTTGIVMHNINEKHQTIMARVEVISQKETTLVKFSPFSDLEQDALPTLQSSISLGDTVQLGWLHDRILVIAPTQSSYQLLQKGQKDKTFINSDLLALHLSKEGHPSPLKSDIQDFCKNYDIGVIQFVIGNTIYKVDAYSFKVLESIKATFPEQEAQVPFFSHVKEIDANWWGEGSDPISNYINYYTELLGETS